MRKTLGILSLLLLLVASPQKAQEALAFDKPDTWSQKYNLVWDHLLELNLFPEDVTRKELAYYQQRQNRFGVPLDNRKDYTKFDWSLWTATMAGSPSQFHIFTGPIYDWLNETPTRVPLRVGSLAA